MLCGVPHGVPLGCTCGSAVIKLFHVGQCQRSHEGRLDANMCHDMCAISSLRRPSRARSAFDLNQTATNCLFAKRKYISYTLCIGSGCDIFISRALRIDSSTRTRLPKTTRITSSHNKRQNVSRAHTLVASLITYHSTYYI